MAFIPVPNTAMVELVFNCDGQVCENTLYFANDVGWDIPSMNSLASKIAGWWNVEYRVFQSNLCQLTAIKVTDLETQFAPGIEYVTGLPAAGGAASEIMPNNVTVATTFLTDLRGRSYRGRNYFVGITTDAVNGNSISSVTAGLFQDMYAALPTYLDPEDGDHVVVSRYSGNAPRVTGVTTPVTGYRTEQTIDSQRRRLPGRGQ